MHSAPSNMFNNYNAFQQNGGERPPINNIIGSQNMVLLPEGFGPGNNDVICGRGRKCVNHVGNARFRDIVAGYLERYSNATAKLEKSYILSDIVCKVRQASPNGGFVKKDPLSGRWYEVGDFLAREKTSQAFRDALHNQYKSSNTAKKKRRQAEQATKLYRDHSSRSLGSVSESPSEPEEQYTPVVNSKFMRVDRLGLDQDALLGALDNDINTSYQGNTLQGQNRRKAFAAQKSARSVLDIQGLEKSSNAAWFNRSCPNLKMARMSLNSSDHGSSTLNAQWPQQERQEQQPPPVVSFGVGRSASPTNMSTFDQNARHQGSDGYGESLQTDDLLLSPIGEGSTSTLFEHLAKFAEEHMNDGNPFEPVPLAEAI